MPDASCTLCTYVVALARRYVAILMFVVFNKLRRIHTCYTICQARNRLPARRKSAANQRTRFPLRYSLKHAGHRSPGGQFQGKLLPCGRKSGGGIPCLRHRRRLCRDLLLRRTWASGSLCYPGDRDLVDPLPGDNLLQHLRPTSG